MIEEKLRNLPEDLDDTYCEMLRDVPRLLRVNVQRVLTWLVFSARRMYVEEIEDACCIDATTETLLNPVSRLSPYDLYKILNDLVVVDPPGIPQSGPIEHGKYYIILSHASLSEFLQRLATSGPSDIQSFALRDEKAHLMIAEACLRYLFLFNNHDKRHAKFPLRRYAWYNWDKHALVDPRRVPPTELNVMLRSKAMKLYNALVFKYGNKCTGTLIASWPEQSQKSNIFDAAGATGNHTTGVFPWVGQLGLYSFPLLRRLPTLSALTIVRRSILPPIRNFIMALCGVLTTPVHYVLKQLAYWRVIQTDPYEEAIVRVSRWLEPDQVEKLLDAINVPYFLPEYDEFCPETTEDGQQEFHYQGLESEYGIRLLEILPSLSPETPIRCRLLTATLGTAQPYATLSYVWGPSFLETEVYVSGSPKLVLNSQAKMLSMVRSRSEDSNIAVWFDYLCINQLDIYERTTQLSLMGRIFGQAREVIVRFEATEDEESVERGLRLLVNLANNVGDLASEPVNEDSRRRIDKIARDINQNNEWPLVTIPFKSLWWRRIWAVREIVWANNVVVFLGSHSVPFNIIEKALRALSFVKDELDGLGAPIPWLTLEPGWLAAESIV